MVSGVLYVALPPTRADCARLRVLGPDGEGRDADPHEGMAVLFPATSLHEVISPSRDGGAADRGSELRVSFAFNAVVRQLTGSGPAGRRCVCESLCVCVCVPTVGGGLVQTTEGRPNAECLNLVSSALHRPQLDRKSTRRRPDP